MLDMRLLTAARVPAAHFQLFSPLELSLSSCPAIALFRKFSSLVTFSLSNRGVATSVTASGPVSFAARQWWVPFQLPAMLHACFFSSLRLI